MIGLIGAMEEEVAQLRQMMEDAKTETKASMEFTTGRLAGRDVTIVQSGIGKVNMALCAQILIDRFDADLLINTGVAGSLDARIDIGDLVIADEAVQHDMDASAFGDPVGQVPRMDTFAFSCDKALGDLAEAAGRDVDPDIQIFRGRILTGDRAISDDALKNSLTERFGGLCCEMEGAAMAQAAYLNRVPCLIIRAISDKADHSAHVDYPAFEKQAIAHTTRLIMEFLKRI